MISSVAQMVTPVSTLPKTVNGIKIEIKCSAIMFTGILPSPPCHHRMEYTHTELPRGVGQPALSCQPEQSVKIHGAVNLKRLLYSVPDQHQQILSF